MNAFTTALKITLGFIIASLLGFILVPLIDSQINPKENDY